jgi:hypothetical protein
MSRKIHEVPVAWLMAFIILSTCPQAKISDVQGVEVLQTARLVIVIFLWAWIGLKLPVVGVWREYGRPYLWFLFGALGLAVVALRLPFYPPSQASFLKQPVVLSLARLFEVSLAIYFMLAIADTLQQKPKLFLTSLKVYGVAGVTAAVCSICSFAVFAVTGVNTFFISDMDHRARGLFNEGGPFGLFLTSVIVVLLLKKQLYGSGPSLADRIALVVVWLALFLSASKAGLLAAIVCATAMLLTPNFRRRTLTTVILLIAITGFLEIFQERLVKYRDSLQDLQEIVSYRPDDQNLVMGRIMAAFVVPRMIAAHPILGIGIGNYSLMRNDPDYLEGLPAVDEWDLPGLGLVSEAAELGIPMTLFLIGLLIRLSWRMRSERAPAIIVAAASFQPISLLVGVNLNFFYPWLVTAFALASMGQYGREIPTFGNNSPDLCRNAIPAKQSRS